MEFLFTWIEMSKTAFKELASSSFDWIWKFIVKCFLGTLGILILVWTSGILYASFHYLYMPDEILSYPVHFKFGADCDTPGRLCSFPRSNLTLSTDGASSVLHRTAYRISVDLTLPESQQNKDLGMFMIDLQLYSFYGKTVYSVARPAMLRYRSWLLEVLRTICFSPVFVLGILDQQQYLRVPLEERYHDSPYDPVIGAVVTLESRYVQIYGALLKFEVEFSGLRYLIFNYPLTAAVAGTTFNLVLLMILIYIPCRSYWRHTDVESVEVERPIADQESTTSPTRRGTGHRRNVSWTDDAVHIRPSRTPLPLHSSRSSPSLTSDPCAALIAATSDVPAGSSGRTELNEIEQLHTRPVLDWLDTTAETTASHSSARPDGLVRRRELNSPNR